MDAIVQISGWPSLLFNALTPDANVDLLRQRMQGLFKRYSVLKKYSKNPEDLEYPFNISQVFQWQLSFFVSSVRAISNRF